MKFQISFLVTRLLDARGAAGGRRSGPVRPRADADRSRPRSAARPRRVPARPATTLPCTGCSSRRPRAPSSSSTPADARTAATSATSPRRTRSSASIQGLVIAGAIRDGGAIAALGFPVFHGGFAPASCVKERVVSLGEPVTIGGVEIAPGDQVIADSDAILVVAAADWPAVEAGAQAIQEAEDELRIALNQGQRLADLLDLPDDAGPCRRRRRRHVHRRDPPRRRRPRRDPQAALDAAELRPGGRRGGRRSRGRPGRRGRPRDDGGDERRARAARQPDGARHDRRLPRRARAPPAADPAHVRPLLAQAAAARRAASPLRAERARRRGRHRRQSRRRGGEPRARRPPARDRGRVRGGLLPALLPLPRARAALRRDPGRGAPGGERLALERDPARAARVRALRDHRRQRLRAAADVLVHRPDPDRPRRDRDRRAAPDHAVVRRRHDRGRREGAAGLRARVGPGGGRRGGPRDGRSSSASTTCSPSTWAARPRRRR